MVPLIAARLGGAPPAVDGVKVAQWIQDLEAGTYQKREAASRQLELLGEQVEETLKNTLAAKPPPETQFRVNELLDILKEKRQSRGEISAQTTRQARVRKVLELIGGAEAAGLLQQVPEYPAYKPRETIKAPASRRKFL
jgi:hypothetical protein